jgi:hypothetical protein
MKQKKDGHSYGAAVLKFIKNKGWINIRDFE